MTRLKFALTVVVCALLLAGCSNAERSAAPINPAPTNSASSVATPSDASSDGVSSDPPANIDGRSSVTYVVGDAGPGGGVVFLIYDGLRYEMAPKTWGAGENGLSWCDGFTEVSDADGEAIGDGAANTAAMAASAECGSDAAVAVLEYAPAGTSAGQWFLPSKDELNAMCNYSRNPNTPPTGECVGGQNVAFRMSAYGFDRGEYGTYDDSYWSSNLEFGGLAWSQSMGGGDQIMDLQPEWARVRPIRSF